VSHKKRSALRIDEQMGQKYGVVLNIGAAQVEQPGDVVKGRYEMVRGAALAHGGAQGGEFVGARGGSVWRCGLKHRRCGQGGAIRPQGGKHIEIGAQLPAVLA